MRLVYYEAYLAQQDAIEREMHLKHHGSVIGHLKKRLQHSFACPKRAGQAIVEYAVVLGLIVAAIVGMQVYAKRGIQAVVKAAADGLSPFGRTKDPTGEKAQVEGMRYESGERRNRAIAAPGMVVAKESAVTTKTDRQVKEEEKLGGIREREILTDSTKTSGALSGRGARAATYSEVVVETR